jgi:hypothetical protein
MCTRCICYCICCCMCCQCYRTDDIAAVLVLLVRAVAVVAVAAVAARHQAWRVAPFNFSTWVLQLQGTQRWFLAPPSALPGRELGASVPRASREEEEA